MSGVSFLKKILKLVSLLLVAALFLTGCTNVKQKAATVDNWNKIEKKKKVIIGLDDSFVPMGFREKNGELIGFDIDLAKAVFAEYGIDVDFQTIDWSMKETELRNGTIDMIWNGYTINDERKKTVAFSKPYLKNQQVLVTKANLNINTPAQMKGKTLGIQSGSSGYEAFESQPKILKDYVKDSVQYDTFNNAFLDLNAGRIQGLLIDSVYADYYVAHQKNPKAYRVTSTGFQSEDFAVGMRKGDVTLRKKVNMALSDLAQNGKLNQISQKWFGTSQNVPIENLKKVK